MSIGPTPGGQTPAKGTDEPRARAWQWTNYGAPSGAGLATGVGAVAVRQSTRSGSVPYAFAGGTDQNLYVNKGPGYYDNLAGPIAAGVGVAALHGSGGSRPYAFVLQDSDLAVCWWTGVKWQWSQHGSPPGTRVLAGVGAVPLALTPSAGAQPFAVVICADHNTWVRWWNVDGPEPAWNWFNLGRPDNALTSLPVGVVAVTDISTGNQVLHFYMVGTDSNLWLAVSDMRTTLWHDLGRPSANARVTHAIGVTTVQDGPGRATRPYVFVSSDHDRDLHVNWYDGVERRWDNLGSPPTGVYVGFGALAVTYAPGAGQCPVAIVRDDRDAIWANRWDGVKWNWEDTTLRVKPDIRTGIGETVTTLLDATQEPHFFLLARDGMMWQLKYG